MAQIINITSEALQATIRRLLPSQQGFGEDLQATNVVTPIIDLTPSAEGSEVRSDLQTALAFGSQTAFSVANTTTTIVNTTGFFRVFGAASVGDSTGTTQSLDFALNDGATTKIIWSISINASGTKSGFAVPFDFVVFIGAGESLEATTDRTAFTLIGSTRQIADINGTLVNPSGFTPQ